MSSEENKPASASRSDRLRFFSAIELSSYTALGILLSTLSQVLVAYYYGTSKMMDAYLVASTYPTLVMMYILSPINTVLIPQYNVLKRENETEAFTNTLFAALLVVCSIMLVFGCLFSHALLDKVMPQLADDVMILSVKLSPLFWFAAVLQTMFGFFAAILQANHAFRAQGLAPLVLSVATVTAISCLAPVFGIWAYAIGNAAGAVTQVIVIAPSLQRLWKWNLKAFEWKHLKRFLILSWPVLLGGIIVRAVPALERSAASAFPLGTISKLSYAQRVLGTISSLTLSGFVVVLFPRLSELSHDLVEFRRELMSAFYLVLFFLTPMLTFLILFADPLLNLLLVRGAFSQADAASVARAMLLYGPYYLAAAVGSVVGKGLYALQLTKLAMVMDAIGLGVYAAALFGSVKYFGKDGIPIAMSIYYVVAVLAAGLVLLRRANGGLSDIYDGSLKKFLFAIGVMIAINIVVYRSVAIINPILALVLAGVLGSGGYFWIGYWLKLEAALKVRQLVRLKNPFAVKKP